MSPQNNRIGLSIFEDRIQLVEIIKEDHDYYVNNVDEEFFEDLISEKTKEAKYIHILQNAFNEILLRKSIDSKNLSVCFSPSNFRIFDIPTDKNLTKNDLKEYIKWEITKLFPTVDADYFTFQKIVLNPLHFESFRRVLVFAIPVHILKSIHKFATRNSLQLKFVDNSHAALFGLIKENDVEFPVLSIFAEKNLLSYFLLSNDNILSQFSEKYNSVNEISEISKNVIQIINDNNEEKNKINTICLFGNNITAELKSNLEKSLEIPTLLLNPFSKMKIVEDLISNKYINDSPNKFSPSLGIALRS